MNSDRRIADKITVVLSRIRIIFTVGIDYSLIDNLKQCLNMSEKMYIIMVTHYLQVKRKRVIIHSAYHSKDVY